MPSSPIHMAMDILKHLWLRHHLKIYILFCFIPWQKDLSPMWLSLLIKQTAYGVASGEASAVDWDELLFTFTPCWRGCYPVLSPPVEVGCWRSGEGPEEGQWRTWSTWPARRGWRSFASCLRWRGYKGVIQQQPVTTAQGFYKGDKSKCFCPDGKMKCHGCT